MKSRVVQKMVRGIKTQDGAGVNLVRVLGPRTTKLFDPILMLDSFDSYNPDDYIAGFPMHPHRGIETVSYVCHGAMRHRDSLGNGATISDGGVQWMCAGSGIMHEEQVPAAERLLGVQLWLNLPASEKMSAPAYFGIDASTIPEVSHGNATVRVLAGSFEGHDGHQGGHLPLDYYDIVLPAKASADIPVAADRDSMVFTLLGDIALDGVSIAEKTAAKLSGGDTLRIQNLSDGEAHLLYMGSHALHEPSAWGGPIVMNTNSELEHAFRELERGTFIHSGISY